MYTGTKDANPKLMSVRVGSSSSETGGQTFQVSEKIEHPHYNASTFDYDLSVLTLFEPMSFTESIQPISLPKNGMKLHAGERTLVTGWGFVEENIGRTENQLRAVSVPIIDTVRCQKMYESVVSGYPSAITPHMVTKSKLLLMKMI